MPLFQQTETDLTLLREISFDSERDLQRLVEANLEQVYQLSFIATEFSPYGDLRIDTLAFDKEQNAFVIIEYKNVGSFSVVDQGIAYLSLMLNHKADFVLKYNEKMKEMKNVGSFDWSSSRVLFVAPSFTNYQREASNFKGMPYELWEAKLYDGEILSLTKLETSERSAEWSELKIENTAVQQVRREVKSYAEDSHFHNADPGLFEVYQKLKIELLALDSRLSCNAVKGWIGFKINGRLAFMVFTKKSEFYLSLCGGVSGLSDPEKKIQTEKNTHYLTIMSEQDIPYAILMAKQSLDASRSLDAPLTHTIDEHFHGDAAPMLPIYELLEAGLLRLHAELQVRPAKKRVTFLIGSRVVFRIDPSSTDLCLILRNVRPDQLKDPKRMVTGDAPWLYLTLRTTDDVPYALEMAKQAMDVVRDTL